MGTAPPPLFYKVNTMQKESSMIMSILSLILGIVASLGLLASIMAEDWTFTTVFAVLSVVLLWVFLLRFLGVRISIGEGDRW